MNHLADFLPDGAIVTLSHVSDWRSAIEAAGDALTAQGATTSAYTDEMIESVEKLGPYIVIAPGFALAHSRPSASVLKPGISWVSLAEPVEFGAEQYDPVRLVVGLAAPDAESHLGIMAGLADVLSDAGTLQAAILADTPAKVREILADVNPDAY